MAKCTLSEELIELLKREKPQDLKIFIYGLDGKGFKLVLATENYGYIIAEDLKFCEVEDGIETLFNKHFEPNGIKINNYPTDYLTISGESILANATTDKDCRDVVNSWPNKFLPIIKDALKKYKAKGIADMGIWLANQQQRQQEKTTEQLKQILQERGIEA